MLRVRATTAHGDRSTRNRRRQERSEIRSEVMSDDEVTSARLGLGAIDIGAYDTPASCAELDVPVPQPERTRTRGAPRVIRAAWMEAVTVGAVTAIVAGPVAPGIYTIDSQAMLSSALDNRISNWYAPFHTWSLGAISRVGLPHDTILVIAVATLTVALLAFYRVALGRIPACVAAAATVLWPPVYGMVGWVGRDVWFTAEAVATLACLGWAWRVQAHSALLHTVALGLSIAAIDARQNGVFLVGIVAASATARTYRITGHLRRPLVLVGVAAATSVANFVVVGQAQGLVVTMHLFPEKPLLYYDLAGISLDAGEVLIPASIFPSQDLDELSAWWSATRLVPVEFDPNDAPQGIRLDYYVDRNTDELHAAHTQAIRRHPAAYLRVRTHHYLAQLGIIRPAASTYYSWTDELDWEKSAALRQRWPRVNEARNAVLESTTGRRGDGNILHAPWLYLLAGMTGAVLLIGTKDYRALGWIVLFALASAQMLLWVSTPAANFRYQLPTVVIGLATLLVGIAASRPLHHPPSGRR
jgi:hypothetical protein